MDYVGHPLMDACPREVQRDLVAEKLKVAGTYPVVGLLPGSRREEIANLLPAMLGAAELLAQRYRGIRCLLPLAPTIDPAFVEDLLSDSPVEVTMFRGSIYEVLSLCHVAFVTSGTATLETAIMGVPMISAYRLSPLSYWVARRMVKVPHIGLVNLVAGTRVVPELIQDEAVPERLAHEAVTILEDGELRARVQQQLRGVREMLGRGGASERTAKIAIEMMGHR